MADLRPNGEAAPPLVTIGLPVYNGERFIAQSVRSVLDQDFHNLELVISDNGSTDRSMSIVEEIVSGDPRVVILRNHENQGAAWNYNNTLDHARGKYFRWHADDDWFDPLLITKLVDALETQPQAVLAHSWTRFVNDDGETTREFEDNLGADSARPHQRLGSVVRRLTFCNPVFGLIRTDVLKSTARIASFPGSDATLLYELAIRGRFAVVPELLYNRRPGNSIKSNPSVQAVAEWFAPAGTGGRFPAWYHLNAAVKAIQSAPITTGDRVRCMATFARHWPVEYAKKLRRRSRRRRLGQP